MISRRLVIAMIAGSALMQGVAVAQSPAKIYHVGLLRPGLPFTDGDPVVVGLTRAFARRGYVIGKDLVFESRAAKGQVKLLPQLVDELMASRVDVLITMSYPAALAAKEHSTVPVVMAGGGDPVATGLVASLARPGGNVTGMSEISTDLSAKRLQLLKETVPSLHKIAMLWNADDLGMTLRYKAADAAAQALGIVVQPLGVRAPDDFNTAFSAMDHDPPDGILMVTDVLTLLNRKRVFEYAAAHKLPAIYEREDIVRQGGLMSYGPDGGEVLDRTAGLADRILKGAKPADLPLEEPTHFRFVINARTAAALGLTIPQSILARADKVIE